MKRKVHYRKNNSWMDLKGDGRFKKERLKKKNKKTYQRATRRRLKKEEVYEF